jgi:hypothetical protein
MSEVGTHPDPTIPVVANWLEAELVAPYVIPETRGGGAMPVSKELTIQIEDKRNTLGKCCRLLADRNVNIIAFQTFEREGQSLIRMVVDDPASAKKLLDADRIYYTEVEVAQVALPHRPGELSRAASRLGEVQININYAYCGADPASNMPLVIFGVRDVAKAVPILDEVARKAA